MELRINRVRINRSRPVLIKAFQQDKLPKNEWVSLILHCLCVIIIKCAHSWLHYDFSPPEVVLKPREVKILQNQRQLIIISEIFCIVILFTSDYLLFAYTAWSSAKTKEIQRDFNCTNHYPQTDSVWNCTLQMRGYLYNETWLRLIRCNVGTCKTSLPLSNTIITPLLVTPGSQFILYLWK